MKPIMLPVEANLLIQAVDANGRVVDERLVHNVMTDNGSAWLLQALAGANLAVDPPMPLTTAKPAYIGLGVGGVLQTDVRLAREQVEVSTVKWLEDPVPVKEDAGPVYLKRIESITSGTRHFPTPYILRHRAKFLESEITFVGCTSGVSNVTLNTAVPVSEAGLYLSTADVRANPATENGLIAYAIFDPFPARPGLMYEAIWEFRR